MNTLDLSSETKPSLVPLLVLALPSWEIHLPLIKVCVIILFLNIIVICILDVEVFLSTSLKKEKLKKETNKQRLALEAEVKDTLLKLTNVLGEAF